MFNKDHTRNGTNSANTATGSIVRMDSSKISVKSKPFRHCRSTAGPQRLSTACVHPATFMPWTLQCVVRGSSTTRCYQQDDTVRCADSQRITKYRFVFRRGTGERAATQACSRGEAREAKAAQQDEVASLMPLTKADSEARNNLWGSLGTANQQQNVNKTIDTHAAGVVE